MATHLDGVFVAAGTRGRFLWEEAASVFTRWGVICEDVGNAAQMARVPLRHIVEEVACGLREGWLEGFLLPANGEPLGPPVCGIFPEALPLGPGIMGGKPGSDSGQILGQNGLKPGSGLDRSGPPAGGAQKCRPNKKRGLGAWVRPGQTEPARLCSRWGTSAYIHINIGKELV